MNNQSGESNNHREFQEIEFKFLAPGQGVFNEIRRLNKIGNYEVLDEQELNVKNFYFDTVDNLLSKKEILLRLRSRNDREITVDFKKRISQKGNLFSREEIITYISEQEMNKVNNLDIKPVRRAREIIGDKKLVKNSYRNEVQRTIINLAKNKNNSAEIEMVLDKVVFINGEHRSDPVYEIEIEAKNIYSKQLEKFAEVIKSKYNLKPSMISKKQRGETMFA